MSTPKLRILVIGAGSIGERHIRCLLQTGRADVIACETNASLLNAIGSRYPLAGAFAQLDDALEAGADAALIATPAHTHIPLATRCAQRGLHLLIEKPLALELDGIDMLQNALASHGRTAGVAYVWRANPLFAALRCEVMSGRWGSPLQLTANAGQHFPTYRPSYRDIYYNSHATGGGAILDAMTHLLNLGEWLAGPTLRVLADAEHLALPGVEVEDTVHILARHEGVMASYSLNQHQSPNEATVQVVCSRGTVRLDAHAGRLTTTGQPGSDPVVQQLTTPDRDAPFIAQAENFLDVITGRAQPLCSLTEGIQTQRAIRQVFACAANPPWQQVAPVPKPTIVAHNLVRS